MNTSARTPEQVRSLPPLILHPFSDARAPERLSISARASLILSGLMPPEDLSHAEVHRRILDACYAEMKMLFYVGKDIERWLEQCMEVIQRDDELRGCGVKAESFAALLVEDAPARVREKLQSWGVVDYQAIFRRALGLHSLFAVVPEREAVAADFLHSHHRYADCLYECRIQGASCARISSADFEFDVFSSGEYARLLEKEWERSDV